MISLGSVFVNNIQVRSKEEKFDENNIKIKINGKEIDIRKYVYLILNKPKGITSTVEIKSRETILDLVDDCYRNRNLILVGRLDDNSTGLIFYYR